MPSVRDLRDRIRSLRNTQQITKAMKQVAAAKIRRAEMAQKEARPYADALSEMLHDLIASVGAIDHPFMRPGHAGAPRGVIVVTADKGLAGAFNANLTRTADIYQRQDPNVVFYAIGVKARNTLRRLTPSGDWPYPLSAGPKIDDRRSPARSEADFYGRNDLRDRADLSEARHADVATARNALDRPDRCRAPRSGPERRRTQRDRPKRGRTA